MNAKATMWLAVAATVLLLFSLSANIDLASAAEDRYYLNIDTIPSGIATIRGEGWYDSLTTARTGAAPSSGLGYQFSMWLVDGQPVMGNPIEVFMDANHTATAVYETVDQGGRHYLKIETIPSGIATITGQGWYDSGSTARTGVAPTQGLGYRFSKWLVDGQHTIGNPIEVLMNSNHTATAVYEKGYAVILDSYPRVARIGIDDRIYLPSELPVTLAWVEGETHAFYLPDAVIASRQGERHRFDSWNDGSPDSRRIVTAEDNAVYVAIFKDEYKLDLVSQYGDTIGPGWYERGETATFSVSPVAEMREKQLRRVFVSWDKGSTPWSPENKIYMDGPQTVKADWKTQYWLDVKSAVDGATVKGTGWYDAGAQATIVALDPYEVSRMNHMFSFREWSSTGPNLAPIQDPTSPRITVGMDNYYTVEALWNELWAVKVDSQYGNPQGEGYYPKGSTAKISVTSPAIIVPNESRMVFNGWTGDINSPNAGVEIPVDGYKVVKANWVQEYYVRVVSIYGNPSGSGWYRAGSTATFTVDPEESAGIGRTAVFERWSGDYRSSDPSAQVTVNSPMSVLAHWTTDNSALYLFISSIMATVAGSTIYLRKNQISTLKKGPIKMFKKKDQTKILKKPRIRMPKKNEAKRSKKKRK